MVKKRGLEIAFSMIFSIILIAAILGVGFYAITKFLELRRCADVSLFYKDLQDSVDRAWNSERTVDVFTGNLPGNIESVCFGSVSSNVNDDSKEYVALEKFKRYSPDANVFLYPPAGACNAENYALKHAKFLTAFFCIQSNKGSVTIHLEKTSSDSLVSVKK